MDRAFLGHRHINPNPQPTDSGKIYNIAPSTPFLRTLARFMLSLEVGEGQRLIDQPLKIADSLVFLPTRRAARMFSLHLLEEASALGGLTSIPLPQIKALGDLDDTDALDLLSQTDFDTLAFEVNGGRIVDPLERKLTLARLVKSWVTTMSAKTRGLLLEEQGVLPSSSADALWLADDLARLMDQIESEAVHWGDIANVFPEDHHEWWQLTLAFLSIVMKHWPDFLAERGLIGLAKYNSQLIDQRIKLLETKPPAGIVIAAGSTGSQPATSRLLTTVSKLENGAVVLPGLDTNLPLSVINILRNKDEKLPDTINSTHPQFGLCRLLAGLGTINDDVQEITPAPEWGDIRQKLISIAMLPASHVSQWREQVLKFSASDFSLALRGMSIVEAHSERQEALVIALALRQALETPGKTAALVTPDRNLARRVSAELERFGIEIDDTAGRPVANSHVARFFTNLLKVVIAPVDPIALSDLIKDPCLFGGAFHREADLMELAILRLPADIPAANELGNAVLAAKERIALSAHSPPALRRLSAEEWERLKLFGHQIGDLIEPLLEFMNSGTLITLDALAPFLLEIGYRAGGNAQNLFDQEGGAEILSLLENCKVRDETGFAFHKQEAPSVLSALIQPLRIRSAGRTHPRLHIYGALEARLQQHDLIIMGSLNEGSWPGAANNDPFLNRTMRASLSLPMPERRIGLAAHDFCQLSCAPQVIYCRSNRAGGGPAIASRWLQRLTKLLGEDKCAPLYQRGKAWLKMSVQINAPQSKPSTLQQTQFSPPVEARPKSLSITEIETWLRDPYAVYGRHVLQLVPMPSIINEPGPAERGTLYHEILSLFVMKYPQGALAKNSRSRALEEIIDIAKQVFSKEALPPQLSSNWLQRFSSIAGSFIDWELKRRDLLRKSHCEIRAAGTEIGSTGFKLRGRADRIDLLVNNELTIIDYKTGTSPSNKEARSLAPQLALEGALASRGGFKDISALPIAGLNYVRLREGSKFKVDDITVGQDKNQPHLNAQELAEKAYQNLAKYIVAFQDASMPYVSLRAPVANRQFSGDYDHLGRVKEWSIGGEDDGDAS